MYSIFIFIELFKLPIIIIKIFYEEGDKYHSAIKTDGKTKTVPENNKYLQNKFADIFLKFGNLRFFV